MLIDQKETRELVRRIVVKVSADAALYDDLTQEAIIHLWLREKQCPGQTQSWYFQSCRFFLQNYLRAGRSVDSTRRQKTLRPLAEATEHPDASDDESASGRSVRALVSAKEAADLLTRWLTRPECRVLDLLEQGYSVREIAAKLDISHTTVVRCRKRIAALASKLGINPLV